MRVQFGVRLPVSGPLAHPDAVVRAAVEAERQGYDAAWVHDYIVWTRELDRTHVSCGAIELIREDTEPRFLESLTTLAFVAGRTSRLKLGTAVLCLPYREPIVAAKQLANLDVLSKGRLILGIGVGANRSTHNQDFEVLGIPRAEKYLRTEEYLALAKAVWTSDRPSFEGRFVSMPETEIYPKPAQRPHPPIWVGGGGQRGLELAARHGTGWLPTWFTPERYRERIAVLRETATANGRGDVRFDIGNEIVACIARTEKDAARLSQATMQTLSEGFTVQTEDEARASALIGEPGAIADRVQQFAEAGVTHFELKFVYQTIDHLVEQMGLFAEEVFPAVRGSDGYGA